MKAYGKKTPIGFEDDIAFAPKSSSKNTIKKGGDFKNSVKSTNTKSKIRRRFKTKARSENKKIVNSEYEEELMRGYDPEEWDINSYHYKNWVLKWESDENLKTICQKQ